MKRERGKRYQYSQKKILKTSSKWKWQEAALSGQSPLVIGKDNNLNPNLI